MKRKMNDRPTKSLRAPPGQGKVRPPGVIVCYEIVDGTPDARLAMYWVGSYWSGNPADAKDYPTVQSAKEAAGKLDTMRGYSPPLGRSKH